ncbi:MAG: carotenoid 1,2-hydratase [Polyangiaceae bacterium]
MSDDGRQALALIFMLGSVFSPRYAAARARGAGHHPLDFAAVNAAVYGDSQAARRWSLTERCGASRAPDTLRVGNSQLRWEGDGLCVAVDERTAPFPGRIRGRVTLRAQRWHGEPRALDEAGRHMWWPIAPGGRAEVELEEPRLRFEGTAYLDANTGDRGLEEDFTSWSWLRAVGRRDVRVVYDVVPRTVPGPRGVAAHSVVAAGSAPATPPAPRRLALQFTDQGATTALGPLRAASLPRTRWGLTRPVRHDGLDPPRVLRTLEDTPFYARSLVDVGLGGERRLAMHESLDLERFRARWVRALLPFRMRTVPR